MKISTHQTGKAIDRGTCATRDIRSAKAKPITRRRFEQRFCGALLLLIFDTIGMVPVSLTHLSGRLVERLDGHVAIDSAKGTGEEKPRTLQRTAAAAWLKENDFVSTRFMLERSPFPYIR